jgi:chromosome segregation ATPase
MSSALTIHKAYGFSYKYQWTEFNQQHFDLFVAIEDETKTHLREIQRRLQVMGDESKDIIRRAGVDFNAFLQKSIRDHRAKTQGSTTKFSAQYVQDLLEQLDQCQEEKRALTLEVERLTEHTTDLTTEVEELKVQVSDLTAEVEDLTEKVGDLTTEVEELREGTERPRKRKPSHKYQVFDFRLGSSSQPSEEG